MNVSSDVVPKDPSASALRHTNALAIAIAQKAPHNFNNIGISNDYSASVNLNLSFLEAKIYKLEVEFT